MKAAFYILLIPILYSCVLKQSENKVIEPIANKFELFNSVDAESYIGYVNSYYFQKTDEFYIELYFTRANINYTDYERVADTQDSVIYKDDENRRGRIPNEIASREFDFTGLKTLTLFDKNHNTLTNAHFVRVEYLDQNISPVFTAVYKADNSSLAGKAQYCIGNLTEKVFANEYSSFNDTLLTTEIVQKMGYKYKYTLQGKHYRDKFGQISISVINLDTTVLIIEKRKDSYHCLYRSHEAENINDIVFVPIVRNARPVLLTKSYVPESDIEWNSLLVFDGKIYKPTDRQRIIN